MRRLASIFMLSLTICAIGGIAWLQNEMVDSKEKFENQLMIRYGKPFDVSVYYDWNLGQFSGEFKEQARANGKTYHIEAYSDGTFYDNHLEKTWGDEYAERLKADLEEKGVEVDDLTVSVERGSDTFLFGEKVLWDGDVALDDALKKGLEERLTVTIELPDEREADLVKEVEKEKDTLSNVVKKVTVL